jgi:hypothetical protein
MVHSIGGIDVEKPHRGCDTRLLGKYPFKREEVVPDVEFKFLSHRSTLIYVG